MTEFEIAADLLTEHGFARSAGLLRWALGGYRSGLTIEEAAVAVNVVVGLQETPQEVAESTLANGFLDSDDVDSWERACALWLVDYSQRCEDARTLKMLTGRS